MVDRPPRRRMRRNAVPAATVVVAAPPQGSDPLWGMPIFRGEVQQVFSDAIDALAPENGARITDQMNRRTNNYTLNEIYRWATALNAVPLVTLVHPETRQQFTKDGARDLDVAPIINDVTTPEPLRPLSTDALQSALRVARRYIADTLPKDDYGDTIQQAVLSRIDAALKGTAK